MLPPHHVSSLCCTEPLALTCSCPSLNIPYHRSASSSSPIMATTDAVGRYRSCLCHRSFSMRPTVLAIVCCSSMDTATIAAHHRCLPHLNIANLHLYLNWHRPHCHAYRGHRPSPSSLLLPPVNRGIDRGHRDGQKGHLKFARPSTLPRLRTRPFPRPLAPLLPAPPPPPPVAVTLFQSLYLL